MDREALKAEVEKAVAGMPDVSVASTDRGVTIRMENVQFEPDSAEAPAIRVASRAHSRSVKALPGWDILVAGYTAAAGFAAGRKQLSEDRAKTVAERPDQLGARAPERVRAIGYGDEP